MPSLQTIVATLARQHPADGILSDPLQLILWENIGYLIDDQRRRVLFDEFAARVGLTAARIAAADDALLLDIARRGGMRPETRVERWRAIAQIVLTRAGGDLERVLRDLPVAKARALLKTFPVIGDPGADKILLFADIAPLPCLDSNGVRAPARLGFFAEQRDYAGSYRAAIAILQAQGVPERNWLIAAHIGLREHGRTLCKRSAPICLPCPLDPICAHATVAQL